MIPNKAKSLDMLDKRGKHSIIQDELKMSLPFQNLAPMVGTARFILLSMTSMLGEGIINLDPMRKN